MPSTSVTVGETGGLYWLLRGSLGDGEVGETRVGAAVEKRGSLVGLRLEGDMADAELGGGK